MKTTHILSNAVMSAAGCYSLTEIAPNDFFNKIHKQREEDPEGFFLTSWIGYRKTAEIIAEKTGWKPPLCGSVAKIEHGDRLLIMQLRDCSPEAGSPGMSAKPHDFNYFEGFYIERKPIPAWGDLMSIDIFEPEGQRFIKDLYLLTGGMHLPEIEHTRKLLQETPGIGEDWKELHENYTDLLRMHFDQKGYLRQCEMSRE